MTVTIFGAKCSPASANYVLRRAAEDFCGKQPESQVAAQAFHKNFYMDDFLYSCPNHHEANAVRRNVTQILAEGFRLTKWKSDSKDVLEAIPTEERAQKGVTPYTNDSILGCIWDSATDALSLRPVETTARESKRGIVQIVAKLFYPLGMALPFVLLAKVLVQRLWRRKCGWDEPLSQEENGEWHE